MAHIYLDRSHIKCARTHTWYGAPNPCCARTHTHGTGHPTHSNSHLLAANSKCTVRSGSSIFFCKYMSICLPIAVERSNTMQCKILILFPLAGYLASICHTWKVHVLAFLSCSVQCLHEFPALGGLANPVAAFKHQQGSSAAHHHRRVFNLQVQAH